MHRPLRLESLDFPRLLGQPAKIKCLNQLSLILNENHLRITIEVLYHLKNIPQNLAWEYVEEAFLWRLVKTFLCIGDKQPPSRT